MFKVHHNKPKWQQLVETFLQRSHEQQDSERKNSLPVMFLYSQLWFLSAINYANQYHKKGLGWPPLWLSPPASTIYPLVSTAFIRDITWTAKDCVSGNRSGEGEVRGKKRTHYDKWHKSKWNGATKTWTSLDPLMGENRLARDWSGFKELVWFERDFFQPS